MEIQTLNMLNCREIMPSERSPRSSPSQSFLPFYSTDQYLISSIQMIFPKTHEVTNSKYCFLLLPFWSAFGVSWSKVPKLLASVVERSID